ncbi:MAG: HupE/UreJ family protein [Labilithrix sp.]|nr:HupE/UreJ family protein [Labilithrix sp.]MCW5813545.1 HupE/UreJ family protein [Labilithrix sp.]
MRRLMLALAAAFVVLALAHPARAHQIGLSTGEYVARGSSLVVKLAFARNELAMLAPSLDRNRDGHVTAAEIGESHPLLTEKILRRLRVTTHGEECTPTLTDAGLTEGDGILLGARWACKTANEPFEVQLLVLDDLARGHRHIARALEGQVAHDAMLAGDERTFTVPPEPPDATPAVSAPKAEEKTGFGSFFVLGVEHILTGYDHLVFVFGLVLVRARLRSLLAIITAFTVAHSITLGVAVLGIWSPSPRVVEPAIALSIAYVGIDNLRKGVSAEKRWRITFPFGLVHGFGFAGALQEIGLPRHAIPSALVAFNLGVENGQLLALAVLLPIVMILRKKPWFEPLGVRVASFAVIALGLVWLVVRVVSPS